MSKNYASFENYHGTIDKEDEPTDNRYKPIEIQSLQHKKKILTDYGLVVVCVWASWCGPCTLFKPKFEEFAKTHFSKAYFAREDIDLKLTQGISGIPSLLIYRNAKLIKVVKGPNLNEVLEVLPPM